MKLISDLGGPEGTSSQASLRDAGLRAAYIFFSFLATAATSYYWGDALLLFLARPLAGGQATSFIYTKLTEAFFTYLRIAFCISLLPTGALMLLHGWLFISPGLYEGVEHSSLRFVCIAVLLSCALSCTFAFYVLCPLAWTFFLSFDKAPGFAGQLLRLEPRVADYVSILFGVVVSTTFSFLVPLFVCFAGPKVGISFSFWLAIRREAWVGSFIVAAILSPPDVATQLLLALPMIIFYEGALATVCVLRCLESASR